MSRIVCHCVGITEEEIKEAIQKGNDSLEKLKDSLQVAATCRFCVPDIEAILDKEIEK